MCLLKKFKSQQNRQPQFSARYTHNMSSLQLVNAKADIVRKAAALGININAGKSLQEVLKSNLGPKGTIKM